MGNVLWLPSWYPSIECPQNGDFIYRHALATSNFADLSVLFVQSSPKINKIILSSCVLNSNFSEKVLLFPFNKKIRAFNFIYFFYYYNKQFRSYVENEGYPNLVHVHVSFRAGLIALWLKKVYKIPYIITEHWSYFNNPGRSNYSNSGFFFKWIIKQIFKNASCVLPVSNNLSKHLKSFFPFIEPVVIPNVVDPALFYLNKDGSKRSQFRFIHVSSLNKLKRPYQIISAFSKLMEKFDNVVLDIVGPASDELKQYVRSLDVEDAVVLYGLQEHINVAPIVRSANSFILFSSTENLPCVVAESLCSGVPVISSSVGGVPEMVNDSNGILVPSGDEDALYLAMESMIVNYSKYDRIKISEDAHAKYNPEVVGRQILDVYERVLSKK